MDEEQTENAAESAYTGAGESIQADEYIADQPGKDADCGGEYVR